MVAVLGLVLKKAMETVILPISMSTGVNLAVFATIWFMIDIPAVSQVGQSGMITTVMFFSVLMISFAPLVYLVLVCTEGTRLYEPRRGAVCYGDPDTQLKMAWQWEQVASTTYLIPKLTTTSVWTLSVAMWGISSAYGINLLELRRDVGGPAQPGLKTRTI